MVTVYAPADGARTPIRLDLDALSPRARALAEAWVDSRGIYLRFTPTTPAAHAERLASIHPAVRAALRDPHILTWELLPHRYPADAQTSGPTAHEWMEHQAAAIPPQWRVLSGGAVPGDRRPPVPTTDARLTDLQASRHMPPGAAEGTLSGWRRAMRQGTLPPAVGSCAAGPLWDPEQIITYSAEHLATV